MKHKAVCDRDPGQGHCVSMLGTVSALGGGALERGTHRVVVEGYAILPCIEAYVTRVYPGYVTHMWKTWQHICAVA